MQCFSLTCDEVTNRGTNGQPSGPITDALRTDTPDDQPVDGFSGTTQRAYCRFGRVHLQELNLQR